MKLTGGNPRAAGNLIQNKFSGEQGQDSKKEQTIAYDLKAGKAVITRTSIMNKASNELFYSQVYDR